MEEMGRNEFRSASRTHPANAARQAAGARRGREEGGDGVTEHDLQVSIMAEVALRANQDPRWGLCFAIPNGGHRNKATAGKLKAEGVKAGVPDLFLPVARHGYHGLFVELKVQGRKPFREQSDLIVRLMDQGYCCEIVWDSADEVIQLLLWYLEGYEKP